MNRIVQGAAILAGLAAFGWIITQYPPIGDLVNNLLGTAGYIEGEPK